MLVMMRATGALFAKSIVPVMGSDYKNNRRYQKIDLQVMKKLFGNKKGKSNSKQVEGHVILMMLSKPMP